MTQAVNPGQGAPPATACGIKAPRAAGSRTLCTPSWGGPGHSHSLRVLSAYLVVVHVVHKVAIDLEEPVSILQPPSLSQPPQFDLPDNVALAAQFLVEAEAEGLCAVLAQEVEAGLPHTLAICMGHSP